jgi:hypothetical protein
MDLESSQSSVSVKTRNNSGPGRVTRWLKSVHTVDALLCTAVDGFAYMCRFVLSHLK